MEIVKHSRRDHRAFPVSFMSDVYEVFNITSQISKTIAKEQYRVTDADLKGLPYKISE